MCAKQAELILILPTDRVLSDPHYLPHHVRDRHCCVPLIRLVIKVSCDLVAHSDILLAHDRRELLLVAVQRDHPVRDEVQVTVAVLLTDEVRDVLNLLPHRLAVVLVRLLSLHPRVDVVEVPAEGLARAHRLEIVGTAHYLHTLERLLRSERAVDERLSAAQCPVEVGRAHVNVAVDIVSFREEPAREVLSVHSAEAAVLLHSLQQQIARAAVREELDEFRIEDLLEAAVRTARGREEARRSRVVAVAYPVTALSDREVRVLRGSRAVTDDDGGVDGFVRARRRRGSLQRCDAVRRRRRSGGAEETEPKHTLDYCVDSIVYLVLNAYRMFL